MWRVYFDWAEEIGALGAARGWIENKWLKRVRCVAESNSKGAGESSEILAVSHAIQSLGADIVKCALIRCQNYIRNPKNQREIPELRDVRIISVIHDIT